MQPRPPQQGSRDEVVRVALARRAGVFGEALGGIAGVSAQVRNAAVGVIPVCMGTCSHGDGARGGHLHRSLP
jgi:hypothetical protein